MCRDVGDSERTKRSSDISLHGSVIICLLHVHMSCKCCTAAGCLQLQVQTFILKFIKLVTTTKSTIILVSLSRYLDSRFTWYWTGMTGETKDVQCQKKTP